MTQNMKKIRSKLQRIGTFDVCEISLFSFDVHVGWCD